MKVRLLKLRPFGSALTFACLSLLPLRLRAEEMPMEPSPVVSTLDFEGSAHLSLAFGELPVPGEGSLNPIGAGGYAAIRFVPSSFPFHAFFEAGGGLFATGTTTGPSGTDYQNSLAALLFTPGVGLDLGPLRLTLALGPALAFTTHNSQDVGSGTTSLAVSGSAGLAYRFFESRPWALAASLRYQTVPGAKIEALSLGLIARFGSIGFR